MGKEAKIGLSVLAVLVAVFGGLLFRRFVTAHPQDSPADEVQALADSTAASAEGVLDKAREQLDDAKHQARRELNDVAAKAPAILPIDRDAKLLPTERFASEPLAEAAADVPAPRRGADPFHRGPAAAEPTDAAAEPLVPARGFREVPASAEAADEPGPTPARRDNPLRRVNAEEPLDNNAPIEAALPEANAPADEIPNADELTPAAPLGAPQAEAAPLETAPLEPVPAQPQTPDAFPAQQTTADPRDAAADDRYRPDPPRESQPPVRRTQVPRDSAFDRPPVAERQPVEPVTPENGKYVVQPNDSLSLISEKVYGNSRYFKALAEHNRAALTHADRLSVGTVLSVPPVADLEQKYPALCPKQRRSALVKPRALQASTRPAPRGDNMYVVEEGDTLFDIARHELGKASRWSEIYDLNRETLGEDFDYLQPGTELNLPARQSTDSITRERGGRLQR